MYTEKKAYKFNFPEAMKFFLTVIDSNIDSHRVIKDNIELLLTITCYSYPYDYDVMKLIQKTFLSRKIDVRVSSYLADLTNKKKNKYVYKFKIKPIN